MLRVGARACEAHTALLGAVRRLRFGQERLCALRAALHSPPPRRPSAAPPAPAAGSEASEASSRCKFRNAGEKQRKWPRSPGALVSAVEPTNAAARHLRKVSGGSVRLYSSSGQRAGPLPRSRTTASAIITAIVAVGLGIYFKVDSKRVMEERAEAHAAADAALAKPKIGGPFRLLDSNGKVVTDEDFLGRYLLIYFGFTHCPDICPEELEKLSEAVEILKTKPGVGDIITPIFITCDPQRDGVKEVGRYIKQFHPDMIGLTGPLEEIASLAKAYRFFFSAPPDVRSGDDYLVDHSIFIYLMDPHGNFLAAYSRDWTAEEFVTNTVIQIKQYRLMGGKEGKENVLRQREELKEAARRERENEIARQQKDAENSAEETTETKAAEEKREAEGETEAEEDCEAVKTSDGWRATPGLRPALATQ